MFLYIYKNRQRSPWDLLAVCQKDQQKQKKKPHFNQSSRSKNNSFSSGFLHELSFLITLEKSTQYCRVQSHTLTVVLHGWSTKLPPVVDNHQEIFHQRNILFILRNINILDSVYRLITFDDYQDRSTSSTVSIR